MGVYVLMTLHWAHWHFTGKSLAPLELNEVMHTLELGIITAGFLFMCLATLSVLIFGRFFCSWGCHILALEDGSAWLLGRIGIRPKLIRSRVLLLVPAGAMGYMFLWPQAKRFVLEQWPQSAATLGELPLQNPSPRRRSDALTSPGAKTSSRLECSWWRCWHFAACTVWFRSCWPWPSVAWRQQRPWCCFASCVGTK